MNPIRAMQKNIGISRLSMAKKIGMPYSTLTAIANGLPVYLQAKTLKALSKISGKTEEGIQKEYKEWRTGLIEV